MATILLGSDDKYTKNAELAKVLIRLLCAAQNLDAALVQFDRLYSNPSKIGTDNILLEFDAHVGDCGCQLRAQMLLSLTEYYRDAKKREWISKAIQVLSGIKKNIVNEYLKNRQLKYNIRLSGSSSSNSMIDILERIGCKPLFAILDQCSSKVDSHDELIVPMTSDHVNKSGKPADTHQTVKGDEWNMSNYRMVARFLSYCRLLSRRKISSLERGDTRIRYRLDPSFAIDETVTQLHRLEIINDTLLSNLTTYSDRPSRKSLMNEVENIQTYITQLTCNWICSLAYKLGLGQPIQQLLKSSIQESKRELHCIPAYTSILLIRFEWFVRNTPLFLVVRRFCAKGYHNAFYRVSINSDAIRSHMKAVYEDNSHIVDSGNTNWFCLTPVCEDCVCTEDWARQPHVIIITNSIHGTMSEFYIRMGNEHDCRPHNVELCLEYDEFIMNEFNTINFSKVMMHIFSAHDQYPFNLPNNEDHHCFMRKIIDSTLGHKAAIIFDQIVNETYDHRAECATLGVLNIQHVFAELPVVIANQTKQIIQQNEKPVPYGCFWANSTDITSTSICKTD
ncbi:unnamed protein product [Adineta steineri]|uniref:Uncharacterized protein n=1 Tax=Adineta steineri TaxID=433720 RepID=A0A814LXS4_9BILA|nr:unnamed protein product [Adineta steineri]